MAIAVAVAALVLAACGADRQQPPPTLPLAVALSAQERAVWSPLAMTAAGIPVLLYHGIGERDDFDSPADAAYGVTQPNFAKQMALLHAAGYEPITLEQFRAYLAGDSVALPAHPFLLTFDDSLASSFDGADAVLRQLGWSAVMFVDVGSVEEGHDGYASWEQIEAEQRSGRWEMQLHAGRGHHNIPYDAAKTMGPFYANRILASESLGDWERRVVNDPTGARRSSASTCPRIGRSHSPRHTATSASWPPTTPASRSGSARSFASATAPSSCRSRRATRAPARPSCLACRSRAR
jgi:Polysaccharide deacetylase